MLVRLVVSIVVIGFCLAFPAATEPVQGPPSFGDYCMLTIVVENRERRVYGSVNTECGSCSGHTAPFGNWGVTSFLGHRQDADQYKGWQYTEHPCGGALDFPEWNSCTTGFPPGPSGNSSYYNDPPEYPMSQYSSDAVYLGYYYDWFQTSEEEGCSILHDSTYWVGFNDYDLYELDPFTSDAYITTLHVPSSAITLSCDREGCATTSASWQQTSSNDITSAEFRSTASGCHHRDGKGC